MNDKPADLHIYTGDGKGKTTAAVGQALRAAAAGLKVLFVYFCKTPNGECGESRMLEKCGVRVEFPTSGHPAGPENIPAEKVRSEILEGLSMTGGAFKSGEYDIVIMDEILAALRDGLAEEAEILDLIEQKPAGTLLILTGRGAPPALIEKAGLVSNIINVKHPYDMGVKCRPGIEF